MAYSNNWNSTNQVPERAIAEGRSAATARKIRPTTARPGASPYRPGPREQTTPAPGRRTPTCVKSMLDLFNNFTYYLNNPILGDQFHQHDDRLHDRRQRVENIDGQFAGTPTETTFGIQTRYDAIKVGTDRHLSTRLPFKRPQRQGGGREHRHLCREHRQMDRLAEDHAGMARRLSMPPPSIRSSTHTIPAMSKRSNRQPEIHGW